MRFPQGAIGALYTTRWGTGHNNQERLEVHGTRGVLMFDLEQSADHLHIALGSARHNPDWTIRKCPPVPTTQKVFVDAINGKGPVTTDLSRGLTVQRYLDTCMQLAKSAAD